MPHHKKNRCPWCDGQPDYKIYHDTEWGVPIYGDDKLFETLLLETFQAGLNWFTVLRKRENFRKAFDNFDAQKIARYDEKRIKTLCSDRGIIRNRLKIKAAINNAQIFLNIQQSKLSFGIFLWSFVDHQPIQNTYQSIDQLPTTTELSEQMSLSLKNMDLRLLETRLYMHICRQQEW